MLRRGGIIPARAGGLGRAADHVPDAADLLHPALHPAADGGADAVSKKLHVNFSWRFCSSKGQRAGGWGKQGEGCQ